jgi:hypothetical protein
MLRNNLVGMLTMESRVKSHRLTRRLVIIHSLTFYYFSEINYFNFCHFFSLGAISYFCLLFSVDKCMTGSLSSRLAQADFNREEIHVLGLSPCKTSKVAMLRNNLVGRLTMESRGWSHRKTRRLVIMHSLTFYDSSQINYFNFCHFFLPRRHSFFVCIIFS